MLFLTLSCRLLLSLVFLTAALSKFRDLASTRHTLREFGIAEDLSLPLAFGLPLAELAASLALFPRSFAWIGALGILGLLLIFIVAIVITLLRGKTPDCNCFGQLHSKPIGWNLVIRNLLLAAAAGLVIHAGPRQPSFSDGLQAIASNSGSAILPIVGLLGLGLLILQSWLIFQLIQQGGRVLLRLDALEKRLSGEDQESALPAGLPPGEAAPVFELSNLEEGVVSLESLRAGGKPAILLFTNPNCGPCNALLPELSEWQRDLGSHFELVILSQGTREENFAKTREYGLRNVLLQQGRQIAEMYHSPSTPSAVLVRPDGTIGSSVKTGAEEIRGLVAQTVNESLSQLVTIQPLRTAAVPALVFPELDGRMFRLSELGGSPTVLLFWNPACGFCQKMLPDLKTWEKRVSKSGASFLIISSGTVEENRKQGIRSRIVLDHGFLGGKAFGVGGTPSALRLDASGSVASEVAVGRQEIVEKLLTDFVF